MAGHVRTELVYYCIHYTYSVCMMTWGTIFSSWIYERVKVPVDKHTTWKIRCFLVVNYHDITDANVAMKNADLVSGFVS